MIGASGKCVEGPPGMGFVFVRKAIAFLTDPSTVRDILTHRGEPTAPPRIAPARGPPLWAAAGAECVDPGRPWDPSAQPAPAYELDQRLTW